MKFDQPSNSFRKIQRTHIFRVHTKNLTCGIRDSPPKGAPTSPLTSEASSTAPNSTQILRYAPYTSRPAGHQAPSIGHLTNRFCDELEVKLPAFGSFPLFPALHPTRLHHERPSSTCAAAAMTTAMRGVGTKRPRGYVATAEEPPLPWAGRVPKPAMDADSFVDYGSGFLRKSCDR